VLRAVITVAGASGFDTHGWQIPWTMVSFFDWRDGGHESRNLPGNHAAQHAGRHQTRSPEPHGLIFWSCADPSPPGPESMTEPLPETSPGQLGWQTADLRSAT
jgi:hypothetical protein